MGKGIVGKGITGNGSKGPEKKNEKKKRLDEKKKNPLSNKEAVRKVQESIYVCIAKQKEKRASTTVDPGDGS